MTPKEKARELVDKYINLTEECDCLEYMCVCFRIPEYKAKQCALIAVDELIYETQFEVPNIEAYKYWQEVKQEIEKL